MQNTEVKSLLSRDIPLNPMDTKGDSSLDSICLFKPPSTPTDTRKTEQVFIMFSKQEINAKEQTAFELKQQLQRAEIELRGKTVLDVGFGLGFNGKTMATLGAKVFGVEPNADAYAWAIQKGTMLKDNISQCSLQYMPKNMGPSFDLATVFLWNINRPEYDDFLSALSQKISPTGVVIIGIHDEIYLSDPFGVAVPPHAKRYFGQVEKRMFPGMWNKCLLICTKPKL